MNLAEIMEAFRAYQFPPDVFKVRTLPGRISKDRGLAVPYIYVDPRGYHEALDTVLGPNWENEIQVYPSCVVYTLVIKAEDGTRRLSYVGESDSPNNWATGSISQALRKTCESAGLGRNLWTDSSDRWAKIDNHGHFLDETFLVQAILSELYGEEYATHWFGGPVAFLEPRNGQAQQHQPAPAQPKKQAETAEDFFPIIGEFEPPEVPWDQA